MLRLSQPQRNYMETTIDPLDDMLAAAGAKVKTAQPRAPVAAKIVDPRNIDVRFSRLKHFYKSALHYWHAAQNIDDEPSLALRLGTATHAMMFGFEVREWAGVRNGRAWDVAKLAADRDQVPVVNGAEYSRAQAMCTALRRHKLASDLMFAEGCEYEKQLFWKFGSRKCSSRVDVMNHRLKYHLDYKTTRDASEAAFQRDAWKRFYPAQLKFYDLAIEASFDWVPKERYIIAQESTAPYDVTVHRPVPAALAISMDTIHQWMDALALCERDNIWPGYAEGVLDFEPPNQPWSAGEMTIDSDVEVDGIGF
jgi:hypothetical protein